MYEKLIELLIDGHRNSEELPHYYGEPMRGNYQKFADYLLENGVVLFPCKVGDTVFVTPTKKNRLTEITEVRHGEWVRVRFCKQADPDGGYWIVRCNHCNTPHIKEYNYCPTCGAKMEVTKK